MPTYEYKARNSSGKLVEGLVDAPTENDALDTLEQQGFFPISVKESKGAPSSDTAPEGARTGGSSMGGLEIHYRSRGGTHLISSQDIMSGAGEKVFRQPDRIQSLTGGGAVFRASDEIQKGTVLDLVIKLPDGDNEIRGVAKVAAVEKEEGGGGSTITVSFLNITGVDRGRIEALSL